MYNFETGNKKAQITKTIDGIEFSILAHYAFQDALDEDHKQHFGDGRESFLAIMNPDKDSNIVAICFKIGEQDFGDKQTKYISVTSVINKKQLQQDHQQKAPVGYIRNFEEDFINENLKRLGKNSIDRDDSCIKLLEINWDSDNPTKLENKQSFLDQVKEKINISNDHKISNAFMQLVTDIVQGEKMSEKKGPKRFINPDKGKPRGLGAGNNENSGA